MELAKLKDSTKEDCSRTRSANMIAAYRAHIMQDLPIKEEDIAHETFLASNR